MSSSDVQSDPFGQIADTFVEDFRRGRDPQIDDFVARYPDFADQIRELLPTLVLMEKIKSSEDSDNANDSAETQAMIGRRLGDYQIIREIGRGGMGIVYEAEQISLGRLVAIKVMPKQVPFHDNQQLRFAREAKAAASLHHTNIVPIFGVGEEDGLNYYVMQFINGLGLDEVLQQLRIMRESDDSQPSRGSDWRHQPAENAEQIASALLSKEVSAVSEQNSRASQDEPVVEQGGSLEESITGGLLNDSAQPLGASSGTQRRTQTQRGSSSHGSNSTADPYWRNIARIGLQVSDALHHAHEQGIAHRDIKPSNLLLDVQNTVWVTDFGLAKQEDEANITRSGDILGTVRYMPPEAFDGRADARSDIYSLGITLYELATLTPAYSGSDRRELIKQVMSGHVVELTKQTPQIPRDLATIISKAIERDPNDRYATAADLHEDLRRFMDDEPIQARRASLPERWARWARQNRALAASISCVATLLSLIAVGGVAASIYFLEQEEVQRNLYQQAQTMADDNGNLLTELESALDQSIRSGDDAEIARKEAIRQADLTRRSLYSANMLNAYSTFGGHRGYSRTQSLLDQWRPKEGENDQRDWEWYYIQSLCNQHEFRLEGHEKTIYAIAVAPDSDRFASASSDESVIIWDSQQQSLIMQLDSPVGPLACVAWDPRDRYLVAGGDGGLVVWDTDTWQTVYTLPEPGKIAGLQWSPDGQWLAQASQGVDGGVVLVERESFRVDRKLPGKCNLLFSAQLSWSADGKRIAYPAGRWSRVWDVETEQQIFRSSGRRENVNAVCFHPSDPNLIVECGRDSIALVWDLRDEEVVTRFIGHTHGISQSRWHPDGKRIATSSWDGSVQIWDAESGEQVRALHGHERHVFTIAWLSESGRLLTAGLDGSIKCWRTDQTHGHRELFSVNSGMFDVDFNHDGTAVAIAENFGRLLLCDSSDGAIRQEFDNGPKQLRSVDFSNDGQQLVSAGKYGLVRLWDVETGLRLAEYTASSQVRTIDWAPDGQLIALGLTNGTIELLTPELSLLRAPIKSGLETVVAARFNPSGSTLAFGGSYGSLRTLDLSTGEVQTWPGGTGSIFEVQWSRSGSRIAIAQDRLIEVWDVATETKLIELTEHFEPVFALDWGPEDRRILSVDARGSMILWDPESGQPTLNLRCGVGEVRATDWSRDGTKIVVGSGREVLLWDASRGYQVEASRSEQTESDSD